MYSLNGKVIGFDLNVPSGASITITGNQVYVNGQLYTDKNLEGKEIVLLTVNGDTGSIQSDVDVACKNVVGNIKCGRDCNIEGDVTGNVTAGRDIDCEQVGSNITARRDVSTN